MITKIEVVNYRTCLRTSFSPHPQLSVLIGPNGSGKTNLLHAITILKQLSTETRFGRGPQDVPTVSSRIAVTFALSQGEARLVADVKTFSDENNRDVIVGSRQRWHLRDITPPRRPLTLPLAAALYAQGSARQESLFAHEIVYWPQHNVRAIQGVPREAWSLIRAVADFLAQMQYYGASQFTNPARTAVSFEIEEGEGSLRRHRTSGQAAFLSNLYSQQKRADPGYSQFLEIVGPKGLHLIDDITFQEIPTSSINYSVQVGGKVVQQTRSKMLIVPQLTVGTQTLSPNQLSEGTYRTLALLFYLTTQPSTLILLEEPEVCIHHGLLNSILEVIKVHSREKQIILSSHSEFVLDHVAPENVFSVAFRQDRGTEVKGIAASLSRSALDALRDYLRTEGNLGEYWRSGGLDE